jgi:hypothetical protein
MQLNELDIHVLGDHVKAVHGEDVYTSTLQRALAMASRQNVQTALTTEAVLATVRTEFLKLLRPH